MKLKYSEIDDGIYQARLEGKGIVITSGHMGCSKEEAKEMLMAQLKEANIQVNIKE